jgi:hypothetical protein
LILDHSFPRSEEELRIAAVALGNLFTAIDSERAAVGLTPPLQQFVEHFEWQQEGVTQLLNEIYRYCSLLFLSPDTRVCMIRRLPQSPDPHPVPAECDEEEGLVGYWAEQLGSLLELHEAVRGPSDPYFVGVACSHSFAGKPSPGYSEASDPHFPLVGPEALESLADAWEWSVPKVDYTVTVDDCFRNLRVLGASIDPPSGGSHHKARFPNRRPWPVDPNVDPVPERFLGELAAIVELPKAVVKFALTQGALPPRRLRFPLSEK